LRKRRTRVNSVELEEACEDLLDRVGDVGQAVGQLQIFSDFWKMK
jgi:hypothetical protein